MMPIPKDMGQGWKVMSFKYLCTHLIAMQLQIVASDDVMNAYWHACLQLNLLPHLRIRRFLNTGSTKEGEEREEQGC